MKSASLFVSQFCPQFDPLSQTLTGSFYRSAIPADITAGNPDPSGWGLPVAQLTPQSCDFAQFFRGQRIVFGALNVNKNFFN
jgi:hypothetical protein